MLVESVNLEVTGAEQDVFPFTGGGGATYDMISCGKCGTSLWGGAQGSEAGLVYVRAGTLDNTKGVKPLAHIYTESKQDWVILPGDVPIFEGMYELEEVWPASSLERLSALG